VTVADPSKDPPIVFNEASFRNVVGYTILWWLLFGFFAAGLVAGAVRGAPVWWLLLAGAIMILPGGYLVYIFCYGGKSVAILNDGIELWISRLLPLNRAERIRWEEIQGAEYRVIPGPKRFHGQAFSLWG
jgi:hypothetical protein